MKIKAQNISKEQHSL